MHPAARREWAKLPPPLADAVAAVVVVYDYRPEDVLALAKQLVAKCSELSPSRPLFDWLVKRLEAGGARLTETVAESARRLTVRRLGDSNVIRLGYLGGEEVRAYTLRRSELADEARRARAAELVRITRVPIGNDNEPVHCWPCRKDRDEDEETGETRSPGLRFRLRGARLWANGRDGH
jgi:hypothetical protein